MENQAAYSTKYQTAQITSVHDLTELILKNLDNLFWSEKFAKHHFNNISYAICLIISDAENNGLVKYQDLQNLSIPSPIRYRFSKRGEIVRAFLDAMFSVEKNRPTYQAHKPLFEMFFEILSNLCSNLPAIEKPIKRTVKKTDLVHAICQELSAKGLHHLSGEILFSYLELSE